MTARVSRLACLSLALACAAATAPDAAAQSRPAASTVPDRGKRRVVALFAEAVGTTGESVFKVLGGGKQVALATAVRGDGFLVSKGSDLKGELQVVLGDGTKVAAGLVGYHKPSDLAILKIKTDAVLKPVEFTADNGAEVGNWVAAVGPAGDVISAGVVSVSSRKLYGDQAFAGNANRGLIGITVGLGTDPEEGAVVVDGFGEERGAKSGAKEAGIRKGDVIVEVAGKTVKNFNTLRAVLENYSAGETVTVRVSRDDTEMSFKVKLGSLMDGDRMQDVLGGSLSNRRTGFPSVIQHDTVLKPADCGGPLIDLDGRVIGLNIARAGRVETWTLPGKVVAPIVQDLLAGKYPAEPAD